MSTLHPRMSQALQYLVMTQPFWATLVLHQRFSASEDIPTAGTDGKTIFYNPKFIETLTLPETVFLLAHEVSHPMFEHLGNRRGLRDPKLWNIAGDYVINLVLRDSSFKLIGSALIDDKYKGWSTERVYDDLVKNSRGTGGQEAPSPGAPGNDLLPAAADFDEGEQKELLARAAAVARAQGKLPASLDALVKEATEPQYPLHLIVERFIDRTIRDEDSSWRRPHRDFLPRGIIMPSAYSERIGHVVCVYDTSGSVADAALSAFHRMLGDIVRRLAPELTTLITCDAKVGHTWQIKHRSEWPSAITATGRGGTDFRPPFNFIKEQRIQPSCLIYMTDLEGTFPSIPPRYPVLWASTTKRKAPFGLTVETGVIS